MTYKSPADTDPDLAILLPIPLLMGALLYARPYSSQSPALQTCLPTLLAVISPDRTATHAGIHTTLDNPHPSQHSYTSTQQQQQLGQRDGPAQVIASLVDQQSSHAAEDPDLPCGPQPPGGSHPPDGPHPPGDPNPHGGPQPGAPVPASPQATSVYRGQQTTGTSRNEVANSVSPTQCASSTGAGIDPEVLCSNILCATPSESVWANIETVALRVLVTLHWAIQGNTKLMQCLAGTAHALLVGHVMDPQLDMSKVLKFGLPAVLKALPQIESQLIHTLSTTCLRHLACLFLRRVATDRHAFLALYGKCTQNLNGVSLIGRVESGPAIEALWCLLGNSLFCDVLSAMLVIELEISACSASWCVHGLPGVSAVQLEGCIGCIPTMPSPLLALHSPLQRGILWDKCRTLTMWESQTSVQGELCVLCVQAGMTSLPRAMHIHRSCRHM